MYSKILEKSLPDYKKPPINEVYCGIRFHTPENLRIPHIGLFWENIRSEYPIIEHAPPLVSLNNELIIDKKTGLPMYRVWFINNIGDKLIQFQFDRFYYNWRRRKEDYPRFHTIIKIFENVYNKISEFFIELELGDLRPIDCELCYINHIPKGQGWENNKDIFKIFNDFKWKQKKDRFLPSPESILLNSVFELPEKKGNLSINIKKAIRKDDNVPLIILELIARGIGESKTKKSILAWFDIAHKWIVKGFSDLTAPWIQEKLWERS